jgi:hypothetical protein
MSNSPGEDCVPPLTLPPLPGVGVVGAVVLPGPTWMPGGPSTDDPEPDPAVVGVVVAVLVDAAVVEPETWAAVNSIVVTFAPERWSPTA